MGVLRMARSAVMETREDSNQHVFRFCGFFSSLVVVMGLTAVLLGRMLLYVRAKNVL